jgi:hypothetical protein
MAALIPALRTLSVAAITFAAQLTPITWDPVLLALDRKLVVLPAWIVGNWFLHARWLQYLCALAYNCLPAVLAVAIAWQRRGDRRPASDLGWMTVALGGVGFVLYQL